MCWFLAYRENKITVKKPIDFALYQRVNVLENSEYLFQISDIEIGGTQYFDIRHNQCACDFFGAKKQNAVLRDSFEQFIFERMKNPCVEPIIISIWIEGKEIFIPKETVEITVSNIKAVFENRKDCVYRVVRA